MRALTLWAGAAGAALFVPALAVPGLGLPVQVLDLLVLAGWPILIAQLRAWPAGATAVVGSGMLSVLLSWTAMGGQPLVLGWMVICAFPFVALMALVLSRDDARRGVLTGIAMGGWGTLALFAAQIVAGAEGLDFRTNLAFRLPPHYGRAFALFPEVSTCAAHLLILLGVALAVRMHPASPPGLRRHWSALGAAAALALLFTRSSSVLVLLPVLAMAALWVTRRPGLRSLGLALVLGVLVAVFLATFLTAFYGPRLAAASAERSASMRLASILAGLSVLGTGELFGVGIGENALVRLRALDIARALDLRFGTLPQGVNSQLIGRLFEEGWPALIHLALAAGLLVRARGRARGDPVWAMVMMLGLGSLLAAGAVIGYRGIYTTWLWLAVAAASPIRGAQNQGVRPRMFRAKRSVLLSFCPGLPTCCCRATTPPGKANQWRFTAIGYRRAWTQPVRNIATARFQRSFT